MPQFRRIAVLALLAIALVGAPILGQDITIDAGVTPGGAFYTIAVPALWNGDLVFWNHGFSLTPETGPPDLGPLQELQLLEGYAVAASGYRQVGWAVFETNNDLEELYDVFVAGFGEPNQVILFGASLGGIVSARAIEQADIGNVVGALPICGAMGGSRNWDAGLDLRLVYDAICQGVPGAHIPGAAKGLPLGSTLTPTDTVLAANVCFGHDLPADMRTAAQQARLDQFLAVMPIPESFINTDLGFFATFAMAELVHNPEKLGGRIGFGNRNVDYGDPVINASIQRVVPRNAKRKLMRDNYTPTGDVGDVKIVSIHTDKDGLVIVENESLYASVVPPGNLTVGIVQEAVPSHCGFTNAELVAAWETLRGWIAGDPQPSALTLQVMCVALESFGGPCRFNPFFQLPDPGGRIRPRNPGNKVRTQKVESAAAGGPVADPGAPDATADEPAPESPGIVPEIEELAEMELGVRKLDRRER
ncbi:MAG: hypothetical protein ACE5EG_01220 [Thermoanaerobaculia bacterium]